MFLPITLNAFCRSNSIWQKKRYTINISTACLADCLSPVFHCKCWEQTDNLLYTPCTSIHTSRYIVKKFLHDSRLQVSPRAAVSRLAAFFHYSFYACVLGVLAISGRFTFASHVPSHPFRIYSIGFYALPIGTVTQMEKTNVCSNTLLIAVNSRFVSTRMIVANENARSFSVGNGRSWIISEKLRSFVDEQGS